MRYSTAFSGDLRRYILGTFLRENPVARRLRADTVKHPYANLQIAPEEGQLLAFLVKVLNAKRVMEIGVLFGYSSLWMAAALPDDGTLLALDISAELTAAADKYWREAGVRLKIDLRIAPALESLAALHTYTDSANSTFDLIFIDADKLNYPAYYNMCFPLLRSGGIMVFDNIFMNGGISDDHTADPHVLGVRELNALLNKDTRIDLTFLPLGDGLAVVLKH